MKRVCLALTFAFAFCFGCIADGQVQTGVPPFGSFSGGPDVINLGNLNSHITIPIIHRAGRGTDFSYNLTYDNSVWYPVGSSGSQNWQPVNNWGWAGQTQVALGYVTYFASNYPVPPACQSFVISITKYSSWVYHDPFGVQHSFPSLAVYAIDGDPPKCNGLPETGSSTTSDGSGLTLNADSGPDATIVSRGGSKTTPPLQTGTGAGTFTDRNGNEISVNGSGVFIDTLGTTALTVSGSAPNPLEFTYTGPSNNSVSFTVTYKTYTVKTNFQCSGIAEFGPTGESLVDRVTLPDGSFYQFSYEPTPGFSGDYTGRVASVQLPSGGTISYNYTGGNQGIECTDGSTAGLTRHTPDGTWTYARSGSSSTWMTTVTDPTAQANQTLITFSELANNFYETVRSVYSGASNGGTLLKTVTTCYSSPPSGCQAPSSLPITERRLVTALPGGLESQSDTSYNANGLVTSDVESDYGLNVVGGVLTNTATSYASLGNGIVDRPSSIIIKNGAGTVVAQSNFTFDSGTPTTTSGTPQHVTVSGSRGNLTSVSRLVQGSQTLTTSFTYFDTGNVQMVTDVNGAATTYNYANAASTCGNAFPTSVIGPLSLSKSMIWNCAGGVQASVTDENGKTVSTTYNDPYFWRINATTDAEGNITSLTYANPNSLESSLLFNNGSSIVDTVNTVDGLSRNLLTQRKQSPGASQYDSVETDHDSAGRPSRTTMPYIGSKGQGNGSGPAATQTYDALNRPVLGMDSAGGTVTLTYTGNDVLQSIGPPPTGENPKNRQSEYNSLGQLTSVCEVTSASGSGTCGQTTSATGYWTKYTYDATGHLLTVSQNAQSGTQVQTRTYTYDDLGRMTSEKNPETHSAAIAYVYDTDATCGTSNGDLLKKTDAAGNVSCYAYDQLHRVTSVTYPSGPNSSNTPGKYFVYDAATVNGNTMANAKTRLAEAYTATCATCSKITDEGFSYTARGEVSDVYESTPHSGGYFHITEAYWANGALNSETNNLSGVPAITIGVDGEGRATAVSVQGGQTLATNTSYNVASEVTAVTFGSSDSDTFQFNTNTFRMTQYKFTVGATPQSVVGNLTWNLNGTLETLGITDPFNAANTQNCAYSYDDVARIASGNCGSSVWSQTFSYDAFGNITKSGSESFQPVYSSATNQMTSIGSFTPSYDNNGDVLNDGLHSYQWDVETRPTTIDSATVTYDALGRAVEQGRSGANTEIVYDCIGNKLALMNGISTEVKSFIPLPGGATAVYAPGGLQYYRHADWLGSSRFSSTPGRTMYSDLAFAPFGETYAPAGSTGVTDISFAGNNEDTTTNLYDAKFREYGIQGRWPSPDPAGLGAANPANPQSWNRYAYVVNNPLRAVDPIGLDCVLVYADGAMYDNTSLGEDQCGNLVNSGTGLFGVWVDNAPGTTISAGWDANGLLVITYTNASGSQTYGSFDPTTSLFTDAYGHVLFNANNYFRSAESANSLEQAVANGTSLAGHALPAICGGGGFLYGGPHFENDAETKGIAPLQGFAEWDSETGFATGTVSEVNLGIVGGGVVRENGQTEPLLFAGKNYGPIVFGHSVGVWFGTSTVGGGAYVNITSVSGCNSSK